MATYLSVRLPTASGRAVSTESPEASVGLQIVQLSWTQALRLLLVVRIAICAQPGTRHIMVIKMIRVASPHALPSAVMIVLLLLRFEGAQIIPAVAHVGLATNGNGKSCLLLVSAQVKSSYHSVAYSAGSHHTVTAIAMEEFVCPGFCAASTLWISMLQFQQSPSRSIPTPQRHRPTAIAPVS